MSESAWLSLADVVLALHAAFVAFVVLGLALILIGNWHGWRFVNHLWFRLLHLTAIAVVVLESWFCIECPLTTLENHLRLRAGVEAYGASFIEYWVGGLLFYNAPPIVFTLIYTVFATLVIFTWWKFPPRRS